MGKADSDSGKARRAAMLRWHLWGYGIVCGALLVAAFVAGDGRLFFWPAMVWGVVLGAHVLYVKSRAVDDDWVAARVSKVAYRSYDLGHISQIQKTYDETGGGPGGGPGVSPGERTGTREENPARGDSDASRDDRGE